MSNQKAYYLTRSKKNSLTRINYAENNQASPFFLVLLKLSGLIPCGRQYVQRVPLTETGLTPHISTVKVQHFYRVKMSKQQTTNNVVQKTVERISTEF